MSQVNYKEIISSVQNINEKFNIAVSGGVDSMLLLDIFRQGVNSNNFNVLHFNHKIRSDSDNDEQIVLNYCKKHSINCVVGCGNNLKGKNLEMRAREQRWNFLENFSKGFTNLIITAHHLNDYVENYIIGNIRGNTVKGCIMPQKTITENGFIRFKPLLKILSKEDIYKMAKKRGIIWNEDSTNMDNDILRNNVRNVIIPEMMKSHNVLKTIPKIIKEMEEKYV